MSAQTRTPRFIAAIRMLCRRGDDLVAEDYGPWDLGAVVRWPVQPADGQATEALGGLGRQAVTPTAAPLSPRGWSQVPLSPPIW
jgi:hypothetical protein